MSIRERNDVDAKIKILFFHNTLPEYRIEWFKELSKIAEVMFVFTNEKLNKKIYGFDTNYRSIAGLKCIFLAKGKKGMEQLDCILNNVGSYDYVELPPLDSFREVICGGKIVNKCKKNNVKIAYFWEKWEAPRKKQPIKRHIKNMILRIVPKMVYRYADVFFAVGQKSKEYFISNGIDEERISIIPDASKTPPCSYEDIRNKYGISKDKKIIMYLGRMIPQKGVQYLIMAFHMLPCEIREACHLLIAGEGNDKVACKKLAVSLNISNITFAGAVEPQIRGNYFAQCDIFVYPISHYKGRVDVWGLTLNEAVQHRKIIIATDAVGSAYELIENGANGFRVEPENALELKEALEKAMQPRIKENAEAKDDELMKVYNPQVMAERYIAAIESCS
ncbi:MAG: glycosyltransferase family 4 protein [Clostridiales bacterium]|nr:glycosyltransferase family 4 protein [Clostridiales bacterium]